MLVSQAAAQSLLGLLGPVVPGVLGKERVIEGSMHPASPAYSPRKKKVSAAMPAGISSI
jgi:hypothetical protein